MQNELFNPGDVVTFQPARDRFGVNTNGRFDGRLTIEEVVPTGRRDAIHPQFLTLRNEAGQLIGEVSDPKQVCLASGWLFSKV